MNRTLLRGMLLAFQVAIAAMTREVSAQAPDDIDAAQLLFDQGSQLIRAGRFEEACPKLESAQRLVAGIGVTLYLAECYEKTGRLVQAWEEFEKAKRLASDKGDERERIARERANRLWPTLSKMRITVAGSAETPDLAISDDGVAVDRATWGSERPVASRVHQVRAVATGREPWEAAISIPDGPGTVVVEVPPLKVVASASPATTARDTDRAIPAPAKESLGPGREERHSSMGAQRITSFALMGLGVVGVGVGSIFGLEAKQKMDDSNTSGHCGTDDRCDLQGRALRQDALGDATISTVAFVGGAVGLVGGAALFFTLPKSGASLALVPRSERGGAGLTLRGQW